MTSHKLSVVSMFSQHKGLYRAALTESDPSRTSRRNRSTVQGLHCDGSQCTANFQQTPYTEGPHHRTIGLFSFAVKSYLAQMFDFVRLYTGLQSLAWLKSILMECSVCGKYCCRKSARTIWPLHLHFSMAIPFVYITLTFCVKSNFKRRWHRFQASLTPVMVIEPSLGRRVKFKLCRGRCGTPWTEDCVKRQTK